MGLFSRSTPPADQEGEEIFDEANLPKSDDIDKDFLAEDGDRANSLPSTKAQAKPAPAAKPPLSYGIEDAISLMRNLPRDSNEVVVTVVKKTLESTNIQVSDIIKDADTKESLLREQHKELEREIKDLQEQISQRNQQISELHSDLKETSDVKQRLQFALELENKNKRTSSASASPAAKPAPSQPPNSATGKTPGQTNPTTATPTATTAPTAPSKDKEHAQKNNPTPHRPGEAHKSAGRRNERPNPQFKR